MPYHVEPDRLRLIAEVIGGPANVECPTCPDVTPVQSLVVTAELEAVTRELRATFAGLGVQFGALRLAARQAADAYENADDAAMR